MPSEFDTFLDKLVAAYGRGRLVPFIGAGMSVPTCPGWAGFIAGLEKAARIDSQAKGADTPEDLVRRAHEAVLTLRHSHPRLFHKKVERALRTGVRDPTPQTDALARIWWPLVLTTNYDNSFETACRRQRPGYLEVLGRGALDCQQVLTSLYTSSHSLVWALQGYLETPCPKRGQVRLDWLARQLVIGHAEYRSVTHKEVLFRRAFAEVFRSRSMLFLGSGLRDRYLLDLFGEILEIFGPSAHPHYAIMKRGELSAAELQFLRERYQIAVFEYRNHADLPALIARLECRIRESACRTMQWHYSLRVPMVPEPAEAVADLEVVRSPLPRPDPSRRECLVVSAFGTRNAVRFSRSIKRLLREAGVAKPRSELDRIGKRDHVARFGDFPIYGVLPTTASHQHDLRAIAAAADEALSRAWEDGYRRVLMQLLATGSWQVFPARMPFIQILRAYGNWRRRNADRSLQLALHVLDPAVTEEIASGRLDVTELLSDSDIRFWVLVDNLHGSVQRRLLQRPPREPIANIRKEVRVPRRWAMHVNPRPYEAGTETPMAGGTETLESHGIVSGSTVVFTPG